MIIDQTTVLDLINKMAKIEIDFISDKYEKDGVRVPRVTEILSAMLHEDFLINWANNLGWKHISYRAFMKEVSEKGTYSHLAIEYYLKNGSLDIDEMNLPNEKIRETVCSVMDGFFEWWKNLHKEYKHVEVVFLEETLIHEYFGGTCDCLLKVDDEYYLIDFKTSNHMNYRYSLQLAAYRFLLKELKGIEISRCTILMLDKENHSYRTYDLFMNIKSHLKFIEDCEQTFFTLVSAYKMRLYTTDEYHEVFEIPKR